MNQQHNLTCQRLVSCVALCLTSFGITSLPAQETLAERAAADTKTIEAFVGETTCLILKVNPHRFELPKEFAGLGTSADTKAMVSKAMMTAKAALDQLRVLADGEPLFATVGIPISKKRVPVYLFRRATSDENSTRTVGLIDDWPMLNGQAHGQFVVARPKGVAEEFPSSAPRATIDAMKEAIESVASCPAYAIIVPPEYVWRTLNELSPELPRQLGGGPSRVLTEGVRWAAIGLDPQKLRVAAVIQSAGEEAARAFAAHLPVMFRSAYQAATPIHSKIPQGTANQLIGWLKPEVNGSQVRIRIEGSDKTIAGVKLLVSIVGRIDSETRRQTNQNRFRQILLGMHNYHDAHRAFPPADKHRGDDGKPRLSWRVHILPFVEQKELYDQFRLDEPWDSPHNKTLIEKMPDIYASNSLMKAAVKPGHTTFQAPVGKQTIFGGPKATKLSQITDGTSNTIALVEVTEEKAVTWTSPQDFAFNPKDPLKGVSIGTRGTWISAFADGSVRHLSADIGPRSVLHLFQMNDGNVVDLD